MTNMRVLIAGFGPFPGAPFNPTALLTTALARQRRPALSQIEIESHVFMTAYTEVDRDLRRLLARKPDIVLIFGLAAGRRHVSVETRARNAVSLLSPDASGRRPHRATIDIGKPRSRAGNTPSAPLLRALRQSGVRAHLSRDAGRYLCNYAYWQALRHVEANRPLVQFVHIPRVATAARRGTSKRRRPSLTQLTRACENLLIALVAASRR
jgi:pyroglutamyl-peptidase